MAALLWALGEDHISTLWFWGQWPSLWGGLLGRKILGLEFSTLGPPPVKEFPPCVRKKERQRASWPGYCEYFCVTSTWGAVGM